MEHVQGGEIRRLWLKVVLMLGYPPVMRVGIMAVMFVVYEIPGLSAGDANCVD